MFPDHSIFVNNSGWYMEAQLYQEIWFPCITRLGKCHSLLRNTALN